MAPGRRSDREGGGEIPPGNGRGVGFLDRCVGASARLAEMVGHGKSVIVTLAGAITVLVAVWSQLESLRSCGGTADPPETAEDAAAIARSQLREAQNTPPASRAMLPPLQDHFELLLGEGAWFVRMDMRNFVLAEVELPAARFLHADAAGAVFQDARLESSDFSDANLVGASFRGARIGGADFTRANLHRADFRGAVLNDPATGAVKLPQNLPCTDFSGVDFTGVPLAEAVFVSGSVANARFADADLSGAAFPRTEVTGADFSRAAGLEDPHQLAEACVRGPLPRLPAGFEWNGSDCRDFAPTRGTDCLNP